MGLLLYQLTMHSFARKKTYNAICISSYEHKNLKFYELFHGVSAIGDTSI